jgi:phosphoribosyl 1,2-cyclic phosphodiesterase
MKLTFLGTRGEIEARTRRHRRHTATLVAYRGREVLIDCGRDWAGRLPAIAPAAVVVTHAHPDHAWGLADGTDRPVYATAETWDDLADYPLPDRRTVRPREPFETGGLTFEAFTVEHSTRCPAVGYRISAGQAVLFYVPDVVYIHEREDALTGADLYVGDGATLARPLVRKRGDRLIGHTPVRTQLTWCRKTGVPRAVITHCGSEIVEGDERRLRPQVRRWARERGLDDARIAFDGLEIEVR